MSSGSASFAFDALDLRGVTVVGHDWGGLIGLRLATENADRIARFVATNTGLPTGDQHMPEVWLRFREAVRTAPVLDVARLVRSGCRTALPPEVLAAYDAPFPDETYKAGPRAMPGLVPTTPDDPASAANRAAWQRLSTWDKTVPGRIQRQRSDHRPRWRRFSTGSCPAPSRSPSPGPATSFRRTRESSLAPPSHASRWAYHRSKPSSCGLDRWSHSPLPVRR